MKKNICICGLLSSCLNNLDVLFLQFSVHSLIWGRFDTRVFVLQAELIVSYCSINTKKYFLYRSFFFVQYSFYNCRHTLFCFYCTFQPGQGIVNQLYLTVRDLCYIVSRCCFCSGGDFKKRHLFPHRTEPCMFLLFISYYQLHVPMIKNKIVKFRFLKYSFLFLSFPFGYRG